MSFEPYTDSEIEETRGHTGWNENVARRRIATIDLLRSQLSAERARREDAEAALIRLEKAMGVNRPASAKPAAPTDTDLQAAAESRAEKLERALELSILCNDLHARIWDTPEVRAKAAAMFDEYGVSNWPDMHAVVIRKARSALSASGGEGK